MDPAVWVAIIVACSSLTGPILLNAMNNRANRNAAAEANRIRLAETLRSEARQDKLDAAARDVARLVEKARIQAETAAQLLLERDERQEKEANLAAEKAAETAALLVASQTASVAKAEETAQLLAAAQAESIRRTNEVARVAEETAVSTSGKLDEIHHLVNSSMTAAMLGELGAVTRELAMMREVVALHEAAGRKPSQEAVDAIAATSLKVGELRDAVADREKQTALAEKARRET